MNVSHEGSSIFTFGDNWSSRKVPQPEGSEPVDAGWLDHCRTRQLAERAAAKHAPSMAARGIHQELAQAYARMIRRAGR